ncbi:MAG: histidine phosphatase family protein [Anaerolineae bacterium]|nr:histidine phosphatase family protein [Anaerolineae bacterium]
MVELWLVRHGQTDWNMDKRYQGQTDIPLNEAGIAQAYELGRALAGTAFDAIFCSDLQRARQTAHILAGELHAPVYEDARLREAHFGEWEGYPYFEMKEKYPEIWMERKQNPLAPVAPGGETLQQVAQRVSLAAGHIAARFPGGRALVVAHGLSLAVMVCEQQKRPLNEAYSLIMDNAHPQVIQWESNHREGAA